jgi:hypothetical protein
MKFDKIYANGSSFTCAGGLNSPLIRGMYKSLLNLNLSDDYIQYAYPNIIAKKLKVNIINEAASVGSVNRVIRKTYEYIYKNPPILLETLFILELPPMWRDEIYSNEFDKPMNINVGVFTDPKVGISAALGKKINNVTNVQKNLESYFYNFVNFEFDYKKTMNNLLGLMYFLKHNNLNVILLDNCEFEKFLKDNYPKHDFNFINFDNQLMYNWFDINMLKINDELGNNIERDNHAGIVGNQQIANIVLNYLDNKSLV